jgi:malonyl-CoA O-methyltransferase
MAFECDIDRRLARLHFSKAAPHYDSAAFIQREIADRLLERLDVLKTQPKFLVDIGCGTGYSVLPLMRRYPNTKIFALDFALPMIEIAKKQIQPDSSHSRFKRIIQTTRQFFNPPSHSLMWMNADMFQLPFKAESVDFLHSSLALQWGQHRIIELFTEWYRVLQTQGVLFFATLGPDTLKELKSSFSNIENSSHVHSFLDMHDLGDALVKTGFSDPVMEMEKLTVEYSHPLQIFKDLKGIGATYSNTQRPQGLMGKSRWKRLFSEWEKTEKNGKWPVTYEVIYGHAWKIKKQVIHPEYSPIQWHSSVLSKK